VTSILSAWLNISSRNLILKNWLCNPTGKVDGWRGWDWLQERNNLYAKVSKSHFHPKILLTRIIKKVVFGGYGSNHTQCLVMKRSILIEVYRSAHQIIENNFYLTHRTVRNSSPKMTHTLARLGNTSKDQVMTLTYLQQAIQ
jgi:hypothetical protein